MLWFTESQRIGHDLATEQQQLILLTRFCRKLYENYNFYLNIVLQTRKQGGIQSQALHSYLPGQYSG